jgi:bacterioferritin
MLRFDLQNETDTIRAYRDRVRRCESPGEFAMAEHVTPPTLFIHRSY